MRAVRFSGMFSADETNGPRLRLRTVKSGFERFSRTAPDASRARAKPPDFNEDTWCAVAGEHAPECVTVPRMIKGQWTRRGCAHESEGSSRVNTDGDRKVPYLNENDRERHIPISRDFAESGLHQYQINRDSSFLAAKRPSVRGRAKRALQGCCKASVILVWGGPSCATPSRLN